MFKATRRNTASGVKEARFNHLKMQFMSYSSKSPLLYVNDSYVRFSNYLANYTEIDDLSKISNEIVVDFIYHQLQGKRRKYQVLVEVKRDVQIITNSIYKLTGTKIEVDFSMNNMELWAAI